MNKDYLKVVMNSEGIILDIHCTFKDTTIKRDDFVSKNWFDTFIDEEEREKMSNVFKVILDANNEKWKLYKNYIKCPNGTHKYIDFINTIKYRDGKKIVESYGIEHGDAYSIV